MYGGFGWFHKCLIGFIMLLIGVILVFASIYNGFD